MNLYPKAKKVLERLSLIDIYSSRISCLVTILANLYFERNYLDLSRIKDTLTICKNGPQIPDIFKIAESFTDVVWNNFSLDGI